MLEVTHFQELNNIADFVLSNDKESDQDYPSIDKLEKKKFYTTLHVERKIYKILNCYNITGKS